MLIQESFQDIQTSHGKMRIHIFAPNLSKKATFPGIAVFTEIYQVTGPVQRFCRQIASQGYLVGCPESYHEFLDLGHVIPYDNEGTDLGNRLKIEKCLESYDEDATVLLNHLERHPECNGRLAATGMCLGGHLAFRCSFDPRVKTAVCYFATDIHGETLGYGKMSDSLTRLKEIKGELLMIFGKQDNHVPLEGRRIIKDRLESENITFSWVELQAQHAFIRDEFSKGRYE
jgi:carboxymethylenebutenolidase